MLQQGNFWQGVQAVGMTIGIFAAVVGLMLLIFWLGSRKFWSVLWAPIKKILLVGGKMWRTFVAGVRQLLLTAVQNFCLAVEPLLLKIELGLKKLPWAYLAGGLIVFCLPFSILLMEHFPFQAILGMMTAGLVIAVVFVPLIIWKNFKGLGVIKTILLTIVSGAWFGPMMVALLIALASD